VCGRLHRDRFCPLFCHPKVGFIYLANHGVSEAQVSSVYEKVRISRCGLGTQLNCLNPYLERSLLQTAQRIEGVLHCVTRVIDELAHALAGSTRMGRSSL
jgi:hypothetical protein